MTATLDATDLIARVRAVLDQDEAHARLALGGPWVSRGCADAPSGIMSVISESTSLTVAHKPDGDTVGPRGHAASFPHIARHDPARVLRAVAWQRRVVDDYERVVEWLRRADTAEPQAVADDEDEDAPDEFGVLALGVEESVLRRVLEGILLEHDGGPQ